MSDILDTNIFMVLSKREANIELVNKIHNNCKKIKKLKQKLERLKEQIKQLKKENINMSNHLEDNSDGSEDT